MTHQELYKTLRPIVPEKMHLSVKFILNDWMEPHYDATAHLNGVDLTAGFYVSGKTPEDVLIAAVIEIAPQLHPVEKKVAA
jgi:hypothetical protein